MRPPPSSLHSKAKPLALSSHPTATPNKRHDRYRENDLVRLDIKINDEEATPLACIVHREKSYQMGKALTEKLKELIPRQLFKVRSNTKRIDQIRSDHRDNGCLSVTFLLTLLTITSKSTLISTTGADPGVHRGQGHRLLPDLGHAQGRARQVVRLSSCGGLRGLSVPTQHTHASHTSHVAATLTYFV